MLALNPASLALFHPLVFSLNVTSSVRPLWVAAIYILFTVSPNFLSPLELMLFNYTFLLNLFLLIFCLLPAHERGTHPFFSLLRAQLSQQLPHKLESISSY